MIYNLFHCRDVEAEDAGVYTCQVSAVESVEQVHKVEVTDVETKSNNTKLKNIEFTPGAYYDGKVDTDNVIHSDTDHSTENTTSSSPVITSQDELENFVTYSDTDIILTNTTEPNANEDSDHLMSNGTDLIVTSKELVDVDKSFIAEINYTTIDDIHTSTEADLNATMQNIAYYDKMQAATNNVTVGKDFEYVNVSRALTDESELVTQSEIFQDPEYSASSTDTMSETQPSSAMHAEFEGVIDYDNSYDNSENSLDQLEYQHIYEPEYIDVDNLDFISSPENDDGIENMNVLEHTETPLVNTTSENKVWNSEIVDVTTSQNTDEINDKLASLSKNTQETNLVIGNQRAQIIKMKETFLKTQKNNENNPADNSGDGLGDGLGVTASQDYQNFYEDKENQQNLIVADSAVTKINNTDYPFNVEENEKVLLESDDATYYESQYLQGETNTNTTELLETSDEYDDPLAGSPEFLSSPLSEHSNK